MIRTQAFTARGMGSIPSQGTNIPKLLGVEEAKKGTQKITEIYIFSLYFILLAFLTIDRCDLFQKYIQPDMEKHTMYR